MKAMNATTGVESLLQLEIDNMDGVHLYLEENMWCAYERSAYYLASLNVPVCLKREVVRDGYDVVLLKATLSTESISLPLSPKTVLKWVADDRLTFGVTHSFSDFPEWKSNQLCRLPA